MISPEGILPSDKGVPAEFGTRRVEVVAHQQRLGALGAEIPDAIGVEPFAAVTAFQVRKIAHSDFRCPMLAFRRGAESRSKERDLSVTRLLNRALP